MATEVAVTPADAKTDASVAAQPAAGASPPDASPASHASASPSSPPRARSATELPLGVHRQTMRCWEYGALIFGAGQTSDTESIDPPGKIHIVSASFGSPEEAAYRSEITGLVEEYIKDVLLTEGSYLARMEIPAVTRLWGDPARFKMKQLEITYEYVWASPEERSALEALERRVSEKAQSTPDLEDLLKRLGVALLDATTGPEEPQAAEPSHSSPASGNSALETRPASAPLGSTSPRWRQLGFQSSNPRTDLRTGRLALEALVYFAERYPLATGQMVREAQSDGIDYPFAVASINITQLLARYLQLASGSSTAGIGGSHRVAPRRVIRAFAQMLARAAADNSGVDPFGELHAAVMGRLHATWRRRKREDPNLTVMDFAPALEEAVAALHAFCLTAPLENPSEFCSLPGPGEFGQSLSKSDPVAVADLAAAEAAEAAAARAAVVEAESVRRKGLDDGNTAAQGTSTGAYASAMSTVSMFGTYVQGFITDTAAVYAAGVPTPSEEEGGSMPAAY